MAGDPAARRRFARRLLIALAVISIMAGILLGAPFLLLRVGRTDRESWAMLSDIGEAYGGVASVFGMLALVGVAASLVLQSREAAANRELAQRTIHTDLLIKALDDPALRACWGPSFHNDDERDREHLYTNLIVSFWRSMFEIGKITEVQLHALAGELFAGAPGRRYWTVAGPHQGARYVTKRDRRFVQILNRAYAEASIGDPQTRTNPEPVMREMTRDRSAMAALGAGFIVGVLISGAVSVVRRRRYSD
ncbi:DUF6082 family protein [Nonomuraea sp. NPDC005650]|uniref:DUF6082 family protein n=1 Tax=Nonomuraea sp. NPDC005650 TaxID=3157045 RepID=UPI0033BEBD97